MYSEGPCEQKPIKNFGENGAWAYTGAAQIFWVPPIISGTDKATNFKFCTHILSIDQNNSPLKISEAVAGCGVRTLKTFKCTHILGASRGLLCDSYAVLFMKYVIALGPNLETNCKSSLDSAATRPCEIWIFYWTALQQSNSIQKWLQVSNSCLQAYITADCFRIFTARCTIVQSAVLRLHVVRLSVCPSISNFIILYAHFIGSIGTKAH